MENNNNELNLPDSLFDICDKYSNNKDLLDAYLNGFGAALFNIFGVLRSHGKAIMDDAVETGKLPHPTTVLTLTLATLNQFIIDNDALRQRLASNGPVDLNNYLKLITSKTETKIVQ